MTTQSRYLLVAVAAALATAGTCDGPTRPDERTRVCGTIQGIACPDGQTCELPAGECLTADLAGVCVPIPQACTLEFAPVCGCDGVTYSNDCFRRMARVQKSHDGECA